MNVESHIGQYKVLRTLGAGGMGTVYLGEHILLGRQAAIKTLLPALSSQREIVDRFFNEARAISAISDPGVVQIFDFGYHVDGTAYIVMEFLEGESLSARLDRLGKLPLVDALRITRQIAGSLAAAHARSIVHRDLKPGNVFMIRDAEAQGGEREQPADAAALRGRVPLVADRRRAEVVRVDEPLVSRRVLRRDLVALVDVVGGLEAGRERRLCQWRRARVHARVADLREHALDGVLQLGHRLEPLVGVLREAAHDERIDGRRDRRLDRARWNRLLLEVRGDELADAVAIERRPSRQHVEQRAADRVDVGAMIGVAGAAALLGRHVHGRSEHHAGLRGVTIGVVAELADAEVEDLRALAAALFVGVVGGLAATSHYLDDQTPVESPALETAASVDSPAPFFVTTTREPAPPPEPAGDVAAADEQQADQPVVVEQPTPAPAIKKVARPPRPHASRPRPRRHVEQTDQTEDLYDTR